MARYVRKKPDGTWYYSDEAPTDSNEPVITEEDVKGYMANRYPDPRSEQQGIQAYAESQGLEPNKREQVVADTEQAFGAPKKLPGDLYEYTGPLGMSRTFTAEGRQLSEGMPIHYSNRYSPRDKRKIEQLYEERSAIATDPELNEDERQRGMDQADYDMSLIPQLTPEMRQPSAQEQFDATLVKSPDGQVGTVDKSGKFVPIPPLETGKKEQEAYDKAKHSAFDAVLKNKLSEGGEVVYGDIEGQAEEIANYKFGRYPQNDAPELEGNWNELMVLLRKATSGTAKSEQMRLAMKSYVIDAVENKGVDVQLAGRDFIQRWQKERRRKKGTWGKEVVPEVPKDLVKLLTYKPKIPQVGQQQQGQQQQGQQGYAAVDGQQIGLPEGPVARAVSVEGDTVTYQTADGKTEQSKAKGFGGVWKNLNRQEKRAVQEKLAQGVTAQQIVDIYRAGD